LSGPIAERHLIEIWLDARDRSAISRIIDELDNQLAQWPLEIGESRDSIFQRVWTSQVMGIEFSVSEQTNTVVVRAAFPAKK